ncbi:MAG TPA: alanine--tRNA ligase [Candidatus Copromorpha excrementigallinarum]|uniref:Alanine--tRNA ligase n=1 Tax=Candidatus Allocopromorpha excrementigallinarum TaxID=2840742 RepID=A0A9D1L617_9FIRM|nr:alanine--tRNA ligase [Candidatus Copromorpha excrementigallinarum]
MEKLGLNKIRELFLSFYESKGHYRRQSFSLIPEKDKSLLIINSGMAPLKPYFSGLETPPSKRMTTCQKCIRTGDIENVGYTSRHGTFFEMLGSFSFGDYFKKESLEWGWEFITQVLKMPTDRLWATVYLDDDEAYNIWRDVIGMPEERIIRLGKEDNFWEIGTGPCGPCSEVYFDRGEEYGCGSEDCRPGCDCDRYVEFWNHVFTQFNRDDEGNYTDLAHPNIDTGMGLERLSCIMQEVESIFDVDTIRYIMDGVVKASGVKYMKGSADTDVSIRIITDHLRSMTFMIGDNILPSNEGRGYVLRRLIRRAARHGRILGIEGTFLSKLCERVIEISGSAYPELEERRAMIKKVIAIEEEKFASTIDQGLKIINGYMEELKREGASVLDGKSAFKLHDTYGFPIELTTEILEESGLTVDIQAFEAEMEEQKKRSHAEQDMEDAGWEEAATDFVIEGATQFTGYDTFVENSRIEAMFWNQKPLSSVKEGEVCRIGLDKTPFYAESGGQIYDIGAIYNDNGEAEVTEVIKVQNVFGHKIRMLRGEFKPGDEVVCMVRVPRRNLTSANHTATHLLHKALRDILGDHVKQAGSSVTQDGLRFDFSHFQPMTHEEIEKVENIVNDKIRRFLDVTTEEMGIKEAVKAGSMALFDEKYGDKVRVVSIGDYSIELCGGTHVKNSGQIGAFKIISESGIAAGVRRIEAVTGQGVLARYNEDEALIGAAADALKSTRENLTEKSAALTEEVKALKKEIEELKKAQMSEGLDDLTSGAEEIKGIRLIRKRFDDFSINDLRDLSDQVKAREKNTVMVFASVSGGKATFLVSVTDDLVEKGVHAGKMIKEIARAAGGGGGGKADMAQAGAKDPSKVDAAFETAARLL